jgi:RNA polymerase sigma-70 factor (sigma-E family)
VKASRDEFEQFVAATTTPLLKTARLLTGDWHLGQDLLQATFTKVYTRWAQCDEWDSPLSYARRVMVNTYCSWFRRRWRHEVPHEDLPDLRGTRDLADSVADADAVERALRSLPRRQRAVLILRFYEDLSVDQTASVLSCPPGTVMSLSARALARVRTNQNLRPDDVVERR